MKGTHFGVQAVIVLTMVSFVSWPQFRPVHAQTLWRYVPGQAQRARTSDAARFGSDDADAARAGMRIGAVGYVSTVPGQQPNGPSDIDRSAPFVPPLAVAALGAKLNALLGYALT